MRVLLNLKPGRKKLRKISKEEQVIAFLEIMKRETSEHRRLESPLFLELTGDVPHHYFGDKTTRSKLIKYAAWCYNTDRNGYLMEPGYWRIVYDDLKKEYEQKRGCKEDLYYPTPESFGKGHRITNLYYNHKAEEYGSMFLRGEMYD